MFQSLTNKILAPHRSEDSKEEHHHHHHHHEHDHTHASATEVTTKTEVVAVVGTTTKQTEVTTTTHKVVDEGIVERETIVKPAIIDEKVRVDTLVEVQPIVHREIDQNIIHHVEQHVIEPEAAFVGGTVTNKPIVKETVVTKVIDEIQPVVHREIAVAKVEKVEEHINEHLVEPTQHIKEVKHTDGIAANVAFEKGAIVKPAIIDETVRKDTVVEVQPVIHRNVERVIINHVEQHIVEPKAEFVGGTVRKDAILEERVNTKAVEEIQPIVHREIAVAKVEKVEKHVDEHIVAPTQHTQEMSEKAGRASEIVHDKNAIVKPAIIDEKIRTDTVVEVQPIVHREIEKPVVHHIEQHIQEPAAAFIGGTYENKPIIDEHLRTKVIDEVQPVVHKERAELKVEKVEEHIKEHTVAPTEHTHAIKTTEGHVADIAVSANTVLKPEIVKEKVRTDTIVEVQPIVHKEIQQNVVRHVEEHIKEPAAPNVGGTVRNEVIVEERIKTNVVDEIQPVVHREIAVPKLEKVEQHVSESVVLPTEHTHKTVGTGECVTVATSAAAVPVSTTSSSTHHDHDHHHEKSKLSAVAHDLKHKVEAKVEEKKEEIKEKKEEKKAEKEARGPAKVVSVEQAN